MLSSERPERKARHHEPPIWVADDALYFLTICCQRRGEEQLTRSTEISRALIQAWLHYHDAGSCYPQAIQLMPDHMHLLVSFSWREGRGMSSVVQQYKRYTARQLGLRWQKNYFDHRIRNEADHHQKWAYLRENPVRAGLVQDWEQWPHYWTAK